MKFKYILSDLDGVIRKFPIERDSIIEKKFNLELGTLFKTSFGDRDLLNRAVCGHITDEAWRLEIEKSLAFVCDSQIANSAMKEWSDFPGLVDHEYLNFLERHFGKIPIAILTNGTTRLLEDLAKIDLEDKFFEIFNSAEIGVCKPDKKIFEYVIKALGCEASKILFIDDSLSHVLAAQEQGMVGYHYKSLEDFEISFTKAIVRRAKIEDAESIHHAHMKSIQEVCSKDHSTKEIQAWGHRSYREDQRVSAIKNDLVWVVEEKGSIQGYGHLKIFEKDGLKCGHIYGLYLTPQVLGKSLGKTIVDMMMQEIVVSNVKQVTLESTITAQEFYRKMGFVNNGPEITIEISGTPIRCYPMKMEL
jgi:FMN phosphatase YigB (HAD superfamily)/N-acetylglutamate synthase-like GNAT family acetyltransferase